MVDVETFGFDPERHAIIEVSATMMTTEGTELSSFTSKVCPDQDDLDLADPEAIKCNGFKFQDYCHGPKEHEVSRDFKKQFAGLPLLLGGWNGSFDYNFLKVRGWLDGLKTIRPPFCIDIASMAFPFIRDLEPSEHERAFPSLKDTCKALLGESYAFHTAKGDVSACIALYRFLTSRVAAGT